MLLISRVSDCVCKCAALVKTLRRGLKEMTQKSTTFVDAALKFERGVAAKVSTSAVSKTEHIKPETLAHRILQGQTIMHCACKSCMFTQPICCQSEVWRRNMQAESAKLAYESSSKQMEAEVAALKRDAAQAAAAHKQAAASWHMDLDLLQAEVGLLHTMTTLPSVQRKRLTLPILGLENRFIDPCCLRLLGG